MPTTTREQVSSDELMRELLLQAEVDYKDDRRSEQRFPFFRPISIQLGDRRFSAFTREISSSGMGLLHSMELPLTEVSVTIAGRPQKLRLRIERCESIGEGWYVSGATLVDNDA